MSVPFREVQASDFRNWDAIRVSISRFNVVIGADFSLARHGEIETGPPAGKESLHHVVGLKSHSEFVAREARLGHDHFRGTD